jgi:hypothetical protein
LIEANALCDLVFGRNWRSSCHGIVEGGAKDEVVEAAGPRLRFIAALTEYRSLLEPLLRDDLIGLNYRPPYERGTYRLPGFPSFVGLRRRG